MRPLTPRIPARKPLPGRKPLPTRAGAPAVDQADPIETAREVLTAAQQAFRSKTAKEKARFLDVTDSEFWVAFCFRTREQKEAFLAALSLLELGDKYVDGLAAARALAIRLPDDTITVAKKKQATEALLALVRRK